MARLLLLTIFALAVFGYGIGVGHYQWPPWDVLAACFRAARLPSAMIEQSYVEAKTDLFARSRVHPDVIMIGDSLKRRWEYGASCWKGYRSSIEGSAAMIQQEL
jgi:hypothetical protein